MPATAHKFKDQAPLTRRLATFSLLPSDQESLFRDWLMAHKEVLFRWVMARCVDADARRELAETAVGIQRLRGQAEMLSWLYGAALQTAQEWIRLAGLREPDLAGLAPELRSVLRLISRGEMRLDEGLALPAQRMRDVRERLLQTRLTG